MTLFIDTTKNNQVEIIIKDEQGVIVRKKFQAKYRQAEKLLPEFEKMLKAKKISLNKINKIEVENQGGSFTSLRIGVVTANALGYALAVPVIGRDTNIKQFKGVRGKFSVVKAKYDAEPNITLKKNGA